MRKIVCGLMMMAAAVFAPTASANVMTFLLDDHPDGAKTPPYSYGLRLDGFNPDLFMSFNPLNGAQMFAAWDTVNETFRIYGTAVHSLSDGSFGDAFAIDYAVETQGSLIAKPGASWKDAGTSTNSQMNAVNQDNSTSGVGTVNFVPKQDTTGYAMDFYADGFRLDNDNSTWVGRGWLDFNGTNDFLFTAIEGPAPAPPGVPEPVSLAIFGIGALGMVGVARRRRKLNA